MGKFNTMFEGSLFNFELTISVNYPFVPPAFQFKTEFFHPNVDNQGLTSFAILHEEWNEDLSLLAVLENISNALYYPELDKVLNEEAAELFRQSLSFSQET